MSAQVGSLRADPERFEAVQYIQAETNMVKIIDWYFRALKALVALCLASMVVLVFGNVVLRYAFSSGITFSEEFSRWLFVWLTFFGAIVAMKEHTHLGMDSVISRLSVTGKKVAYIVSHLLMIGCVLLLLSGGWDQTVVNIETKAAATGLSAALFYGIILVFGVSALCILIYDLYLVLAGKLKVEQLIQVKESEEEFDAEKHEAKLDGEKAQDAASMQK
jgi:TRAP-type C4-dicarboxylate transport system permease small subunit